MTIAHEITEKTSRMASTACETGEASAMISITFPVPSCADVALPSSCSARTNEPGVGNKASEVVLLWWALLG
jgi:hypothetical protein